jgi:hypothetical protein
MTEDLASCPRCLSGGVQTVGITVATVFGSTVLSVIVAPRNGHRVWDLCALKAGLRLGTRARP